MNSDIAQGSIKELKGKIKHTWGKLTDDDINSLDGGVDQFIGKVQVKGQFHGVSTLHWMSVTPGGVREGKGIEGDALERVIRFNLVPLIRLPS